MRCAIVIKWRAFAQERFDLSPPQLMPAYEPLALCLTMFSHTSQSE